MPKKTFLSILDNLEGYVCQMLLVFFVIMLLLQIALRPMGLPLYWTEEMARYSFVWFVFFGASYATRLCAHNRMTVQFSLFPRWVGDVCLLAGDGAWLVFNTVMVVKSLEVIEELHEFPYATPALDWQLADIYLIFPIAFTLMSVRVVQTNVIKFLLRRKEARQTARADAQGGKA